MAKRFTDTERFRDPWYRKLTPVQKCIWEYMLSECDHAGVLNFDLESMSFHIGAAVLMEDVEAFGDRIVFIRADILFIPKFIKFQYGELNTENKAHQGVIKVLNEYNINLSRGIEAPAKGLSRGYIAPQDKDKDKIKDKQEGGVGETVKTSKMKSAKILFDKVETDDWEKLFAYWVQEKAGTKYTQEGREYAFSKLKELSGNDFYVASCAIQHAAAQKYQGFFGSDGLFYDVRKKGEMPPVKIHSSVSSFDRIMAVSRKVVGE